MNHLLRWLIAFALVAGSLLVLSGLLAGELDAASARLLVSLAVIVVGGSLLVIDRTYPEGLKTRVLGIAGAAATLAAVVISFLLIWSDLVTDRYLWRAWWFSSAVAVHIAHLLALLRARTSPRRLLILRNLTIAAAVLLAALLVGMTFRRDVLSLPGGALTVCLGVFFAVSALGSAALFFWARPQARALRLPGKVLRAAWRVALPLLVFAGGFYLGRVTTPPPGVLLDSAGGFLASLPPETIDQQVQKDLVRLEEIQEGVERLRVESARIHRDLVRRREADPSLSLTPVEEDELRSAFFSYLSYRTALLRMVAYYQGFEGVSDRDRRSRCFLVGFAAGSMCFSVSLELISTFRGDDLVRKKLNEAEPRWWIPAGMFDQIEASVSLKQNVDLFQEMTLYYETHRDRWRGCGFESHEISFLASLVEHAVTGVETNPEFGKRRILAPLLARVKQDSYTPVYVVQTLVSTWIGDTRLVSRRPCISPEQVEVLRDRIRPGDIILERRNWFLSNAFLPGFWPHAALYAGTHDDLKRLGIAEDPAIQKRLQEYLARAHDGEAKVVIESISEGVSFTSLSEATLADYIAVLRPRLSEADKARAILRAFSHQGKPYDFDFDFESADKLVCTELVYRSYDDMIDLPLVKIMGRNTLPALEIARKYRDEKGTARQQLDFVLFLDTPQGADRAVLLEDDSAFRDSVDRPRAFNE